MSGPKAADVALKLERVLEAAGRQAREAQDNAARYGQMGIREVQASRTAAIQVRQGCSRGASSEARQFATNELASISTASSNIDQAIGAGDQMLAGAERLRSEATTLHIRSESLMQETANLCQQVGNSLAYSEHYLYEEDQQAQRARGMAQQAVDLERQASRKLQAAMDQTNAARNAFDSASAAGGNYQGELNRIERLATERHETARIAEEDKRKATANVQEAESLLTQIEGLNHKKFAPGEHSSLQPQLAGLSQAFANSDYGQVNASAERCLGQARTLARKVADKQAEWEAARTAAANDLEMGGQETSNTDREFVARWSGSPDAVDQAFDRLDEAKRAFDNEEFAAAQKGVSEAVASLRTLTETASVNKANFDQRDEIAQAIMSALYEQGYDAPTFYFAGHADGEGENELSDLTIFAKSPGDKGDMRMKINLEGHVDLEIEDIPEGEEQACHEMIGNLQKGLAGDVDFRMTDWGRAAGVSDQKHSLRAKEKTKSKTKERHGG